MIKKLLCLSIGIFLMQCANLDGVNPLTRNSFVYYYGSVANYQAVSALELSDGYLLIGDSISNTKYSIIAIRTDKGGRTIWRKKIDNAVANAAMVTTGGGYLIIGDSMNVDRNQTNVAFQIKRKMRLISLSSSGSKLADQSWGDPTNSFVDYSGSAVTADANSILVIGSVNHRADPTGDAKNVNDPPLPIYAQVTSHNPTTLAINWSAKYNQDVRDYVNSKSAFVTGGGDVIWATSAELTNSATARSFLRAPVFAQNSTFVNSALFGQNDLNYPDIFYSGSDIQPTAVGYGIVGTYANYQITSPNDVGDKANIFFIRTDLQGNIINNSDLYFDGATIVAGKKALTNAEASTTSLVQDAGITLATTAEGGFLLAGYTTSTTDGGWGNGGKDIFLIRLDPFGNFQWYKTFGGSGDEVPSTVRQTADGGFIISGTLTLAGQSSMFLLKTDSNGELKD